MLIALEIFGWFLIAVELFGAKEEADNLFSSLHDWLHGILTDQDPSSENIYLVTALYFLVVGPLFIFSDLMGDPFGLAFFQAPEVLKIIHSFVVRTELSPIFVAAILFLMTLLPLYFLLKLAQRHPGGTVSGLGVALALGSSVMARV